MLSGLLRNEVAIKVSIKIMDAFVEMRKFVTNNANIFNLSTRVENKFLEYDRKFDIVFDELHHSGASLKDLGKKCFAISKIEDIEYIEKLSKFT